MKLIVIDDDPIVSSSLKTILEQHAKTQVVAIGHDGEQALELYRTYQPDILMMDIRMSTVNGIDAGRAVLQCFPDAKIVFLTTFQDEEYLEQAMQIGARGYLLKQDFNSLHLALQSIMANQIVLGTPFIKSAKKVPSQHLNAINAKERELLELIAKGHSNKEIAQTLGYSEGTVRNQISRLLEKLDVRDRTQLVIYYFNTLV